MTATKSYKNADDVKESHWRMEITFGAALEILQNQFKMEENKACDMLFPPLGEGPMDFDITPDTPIMRGYENMKWKDREQRMLKEEE